MWGCEDEQMWRWEDVKIRNCEDEKMWRWEDMKMWGCEDEKMKKYEDEKMWRCEDVKMRRWNNMKMRRCEDEKMWRWEDVKMRRCEDEKMRRCEDEKMWRWEDERQTPTIGRTLRSDALGKKVMWNKRLMTGTLTVIPGWFCYKSCHSPENTQQPSSFKICATGETTMHACLWNEKKIDWT